MRLRQRKIEAVMVAYPPIAIMMDPMSGSNLVRTADTRGNDVQEERNPPNRNNFGKLLAVIINVPFLRHFLFRNRIL